jgi:predicted AAA+ superfamily ATPase
MMAKNVKKELKRKELEKTGARLPKRVIERRIRKKIITWMDREEVIVITGARQTGKSVLLYELIYEFLLPKTNNVYYFNLDVPNQLKFFQDPFSLVNLVRQCRGKVYVLIDEIQRLKEPGLFLKGIYDLHLPLKMIVSGSSALEIKSKIHEALTGRKVLFHLEPFDLIELSSVLFPRKDFCEVQQNEGDFRKVLGHYLTYGGYPAVAMAQDSSIKLQLLNEIFHSYLEKDVRDFLGVENETAFRNLVKILSSQIGNLVNKDELSNTLGIHKNTLEHYLFYLEETYIVDFVHPFHRNQRKELLKSPKVYFRDIGVRNFSISNFSDFEFRPDKGSLFENFVYHCLKQSVPFSEPI